MPRNRRRECTNWCFISSHLSICALIGDETRVRTIRHVFTAFLWVKLAFRKTGIESRILRTTVKCANRYTTNTDFWKFQTKQRFYTSSLLSFKDGRHRSKNAERKINTLSAGYKIYVRGKDRLYICILPPPWSLQCRDVLYTYLHWSGHRTWNG